MRYVFFTLPSVLLVTAFLFAPQGGHVGDPMSLEEAAAVHGAACYYTESRTQCGFYHDLGGKGLMEGHYGIMAGGPEDIKNKLCKCDNMAVYDHYVGTCAGGH